MIKKREFSSSSLKEAIAIAAHEFNVDEEKINYEIITEKTKYFGHKQREIYITAWPSDGSELQDIKDFVSKLFELMNFDLDFNISAKKDFLRIDFKGEDFRLLLYQNGNLLNAFQYLLNRLFSDMIGKKIYCECENFRKSRERELTNLAHRYAKEIRRDGKPIKLKELNPFERRIIHMTINKYSDLESKSTGESFLKVILIKKSDGS